MWRRNQARSITAGAVWDMVDQQALLRDRTVASGVSMMAMASRYGSPSVDNIRSQRDASEHEVLHDKAWQGRATDVGAHARSGSGMQNPVVKESRNLIERNNALQTRKRNIEDPATESVDRHTNLPVIPSTTVNSETAKNWLIQELGRHFEEFHEPGDYMFTGE
ncbi:hypothetical protein CAUPRSCDRAFT_12740 [Caulochytrium protostelioides]|uniref:Uncharacterized protein n=1 Tax=Caulochytrium protostelioides TaxID=1555241 RepID=A0A4P9WT27_9FUNG|nr:hypothetical protein CAUPRSCDRAFT_12740 [Caulochytrium protostelioides]